MIKLNLKGGKFQSQINYEILKKEYGMKKGDVHRENNLATFNSYLKKEKHTKIEELSEDELRANVVEFRNYLIKSDEEFYKKNYQLFKEGHEFKLMFSGMRTTTGFVAGGDGIVGGMGSTESKVSFFTCKFHMDDDVFVYGEQGDKVMGSFSINDIKSLNLKKNQLDIIDKNNNRLMISRGLTSSMDLPTLHRCLLQLREELGVEDSEMVDKKTPPKTESVDPVVEIEKYFNLKEKGIITEEEFEIKKKEFLGLSENDNSKMDRNIENQHEKIEEEEMEIIEGNIIICPNCNQEIKSDVNFCTKCGFKLDTILKCPNCDYAIKENDKFCTNCGYKL